MSATEESLIIHSDAEYEASPLAPPNTISDEDYQELQRSIVANGGPDKPSVLFQGKVLEGRNRYKVCVENGITPEFREWGTDPGDGDKPRQWAMSQRGQALLPADETRLRECEQEIAENLRGFIIAGRALKEVHDRELWRLTHGSYGEWLADQFPDMTRRHADRLRAGTEVVDILPPNGPTPATEAVARELVPLKDKPHEMRAAWTEAINEHGERPTATQVREVVADHLPPPAKPDKALVVDPGTGEVIGTTDYAAEAEAVKPDDPLQAERDYAGERDPKLDDFGDSDDGSTRQQDTAGVHTVLGFVDQVTGLPGAISLSERMNTSQKRHALAGIPRALTYLETLQTALKTSQ